MYTLADNGAMRAWGAQMAAGNNYMRSLHRQALIDRAVFTPPDLYEYPADWIGYDPRNHVGRHA